MPNQTPQTIEELKAWYIAHDLPPEDVTRFFIGKDIREPKAFGIYRDGDRFVVYKNKADGSRAVRYQGPDEGYAVQELYNRLKQEIAQQKERNAVERAAAAVPDRRKKLFMVITAAVSAAIFAVGLWITFHDPDPGYYRDRSGLYYYDTTCWYLFADDGWSPCPSTPEVASGAKDAYLGTEYSPDYNAADFALSEYYRQTDTDSSWSSSDSWDSGSTDWSSDW